MSVIDSSDGGLAPGLLPSDPGSLESSEIERLWSLFVAIAKTWGPPEPGPSGPLAQRSQWLEFVQLRTRSEPSYLEEYRNAVRVLDAFQVKHKAGASEALVMRSGLKPTDPVTTPVAHAKKYVVDEFIRVWLATGGFRQYGAGNYNGYISGSRFAVRPPYRGLLGAKSHDVSEKSGPNRASS